MDWTEDIYNNMTEEEANELTGMDVIDSCDVFLSKGKDLENGLPQKIIKSKYRHMYHIIGDELNSKSFRTMYKIAFARCANCKYAPEDKIYDDNEYIEPKILSGFKIEGYHLKRGCDYARQNGFRVMSGNNFNKEICPYYEPKE